MTVPVERLDREFFQLAEAEGVTDIDEALQFDSSDVGGVIEDLDLMLKDLLVRIERARADYLQEDAGGSADERLEKITYGRFLEPEPRKAFFEAYKELEALWEILSPSPELRDHIASFKRLAQLYAAVRNAYSDRGGYVADLAYKTGQLVKESVVQYGLGQGVRKSAAESLISSSRLSSPASPMPRRDTRRARLRQRVVHWSRRVRARPRIVRVQRMTWKLGSCSTNGVLTLADDLCLRPGGFQDFVILHELLHLRVPNHGRLFKAMMAVHLPEWRKYDVMR